MQKYISHQHSIRNTRSGVYWPCCLDHVVNDQKGKTQFDLLPQAINNHKVIIYYHLKSPYPWKDGVHDDPMNYSPKRVERF